MGWAVRRADAASASPMMRVQMPPAGEEEQLAGGQGRARQAASFNLPAMVTCQGDSASLGVQVGFKPWQLAHVEKMSRQERDGQANDGGAGSSYRQVILAGSPSAGATGKGDLTGPQMVTQSSRLSRKLLGSKGCQWVKLTRLPSDHSKFICSFRSLRPIHSSSTSGVQPGQRRDVSLDHPHSRGGRGSPQGKEGRCLALLDLLGDELQLGHAVDAEQVAAGPHTHLLGLLPAALFGLQAIAVALEGLPARFTFHLHVGPPVCRDPHAAAQRLCQPVQHRHPVPDLSSCQDY